MDEEKERLLMCLRIEDMPEPNTDGTRRGGCDFCQEPVWVSAAGQKMMIEGGIKIICNRCAEKELKDDGDGPPEMQIPPSVIQEALDQIILDARREGARPKQVFDFVKRLCELPRK